MPRLAGLPDDAFEHDGQLTKRVVRAATLAALAPLPGETLWDIGAGCGSIAIEWLRAGEGRSRSPSSATRRAPAMIARNAAALGVPGLRIVAGAAPRGARGLPAPDAIFVGGGIGEPGLLPLLWTGVAPGRTAGRQCRHRRRAKRAHSRLAGALRRRADARSRSAAPSRSAHATSGGHWLRLLSWW